MGYFRFISIVLICRISISLNAQPSNSCDNLRATLSSIQEMPANSDQIKQLESYFLELNSQDDLGCRSELKYNGLLSLFNSYLEIGNYKKSDSINRLLMNRNKSNPFNESQIVEYEYLKSKQKYLLGNFRDSNDNLNFIIKNGINIRSQLLSDIYNLKGQNFLQLFNADKAKTSNLDSSAQNFNTSYFYSKKDSLTNRKQKLLEFYNNKLDVLYARKNYQEVIKNADKAIILSKNQPNRASYIFNFQLKKAQSLFKLNEYDSVLEVTNSLQNEIGDVPLNQKIIFYNLIQKSYEQKGEKDSTSKYLKLSLKNLEEYNQTTSHSLRSIHDIEIDELQQENKIIYEKNGRKNVYLTLLVVLLLVAILFFSYYRKQKIKHEKEFEEKFKELHALQAKANVKKGKGKTQNENNSLSEEIIDDISQKLKKVEAQKLYLNPKFTLAFLAKKIGTNTSYLSYYFNHVKKQSFPNYLNHLRINYLLEELENNPKWLNYSIEGLAKEIGYKDAGSFSKAFKKIVEIPPSFYLEKLRENKI